jgi:hypothetical protein
MPQYEYKVIPAPAKGEKAKGVRSPEDRFAYALEALMNRMGEAGWEFQRAEMLPSEERQGLTKSVTNWRHLLVFRRPKQATTAAFKPRLLEPPAPLRPASGAERMLKDNGVEEVSEVAGMTTALMQRAKQNKETADETPAPFELSPEPPTDPTPGIDDAPAPPEKP